MPKCPNDQEFNTPSAPNNITGPFEIENKPGRVKYHCNVCGGDFTEPTSSSIDEQD